MSFISFIQKIVRERLMMGDHERLPLGLLLPTPAGSPRRWPRPWRFWSSGKWNFIVLPVPEIP